MERIKGGLGLTPAEVDAIMLDLTGSAAPSAAAATVTPTTTAARTAATPSVKPAQTAAALAIASRMETKPTTLVTMQAPPVIKDNRKTADTTGPLRPAPPLSPKEAAKKAPLASVATGAITGMLVGGPVGALVGGAAGWWLGKAAATKGLPLK